MTRKPTATGFGPTPSGLEVAQINVLMNLKQAGQQELQRLLAAKGVRSIEELDGLTARNFLEYLRSL